MEPPPPAMVQMAPRRPTTTTSRNPTAGSVISATSPWTSASSSWGPVSANKSNGEQAAGDGHGIRIDGNAYDKGLGVAAGSTITYNLAGKYTDFFSWVGIDDEVGNSGSAVFQVYADGNKIYDSGKLTGSSKLAWAQLKVNGVQQLKLVTTNAGDNDSYDHADWGRAMVW